MKPGVDQFAVGRAAGGEQTHPPAGAEAEVLRRALAVMCRRADCREKVLPWLGSRLAADGILVAVSWSGSAACPRPVLPMGARTLRSCRAAASATHRSAAHRLRGRCRVPLRLVGRRRHATPGSRWWIAPRGDCAPEPGSWPRSSEPARNGKAGGRCSTTGPMRNFTADAPNRLWLKRITENMERKSYLCAIKDPFSEGASWAGILSPTACKPRRASDGENAIARRGDVAGGVVHSDRGSQFRSRKVLRTLERHGLVDQYRARRCCRGQRGHGQASSRCCRRRPQPPLRGQPDELENRDRGLDRAEVSPAAPSGSAGPFDPIELKTTMSTNVAVAA